MLLRFDAGATDILLSAGEGALSGAKKVLLEPSGENEINSILAKCEHIGLHKDKDFEEIFAGSMHF